MPHAIHRVASFVVVAPYTLRVAFADGSEHRIDFRPVLRGPLYGRLQEPQMFKAAAADTAST
jgi:hypothetical protein